MILAVLGNQEEVNRRTRQVVVIKDSPGPLGTDGFKFMHELCYRVMGYMLQLKNVTKGEGHKQLWVSKPKMT